VSKHPFEAQGPSYSPHWSNCKFGKTTSCEVLKTF